MQLVIRQTPGAGVPRFVVEHAGSDGGRHAPQISGPASTRVTSRSADVCPVTNTCSPAVAWKNEWNPEYDQSRRSLATNRNGPS